MNYTPISNGNTQGLPQAVLTDKPEAYRILLVDDEPNVLNALIRVFRQENYEITTSPNALDALEKLRNTAFHLMITDYTMPGMRGADLLREARKIHPEMIRIILTGHADTDDVMEAIKDGVVYKFILKPWDDNDLRVTVVLALMQYELIRKNRLLEQENAFKAKEIKALSKVYGSEDEVYFKDSELPVGSADHIDEENDEQASPDELLQATEESPVVHQVNAAVLEAIRLGASDIHIQPCAKNIIVRWHIDGGQVKIFL